MTYKNLSGLLVLAIVGGLIFTSCSKIVNINLNTANAQVVIQGYVTDQQNIDTVKLTRTGSYYAPGSYPTINGAIVIISDNTGVRDTLKQIDSGTYVPTSFIGVPGRTYSLKVLTGGREYDAVSTMPLAVSIDSVVKQSNTSFGGEVQNQIRCFFRDPPSVGHYYMADLIVNDTLHDSLDNLTLLNDQFVAGNEVNIRIRGYNAITGDTVTVQLMSIDAATYNYFSVVRSIAAAGNPVSTAVPQNPPTNIIGGAYGYFSAYTIRSKTLVVP